MDQSSRDLADAGRLLVRTFDQYMQDAQGSPGATTETRDTVASARTMDTLRSARQKLGSALECLYLYRGVDAGVATSCRIAVERLDIHLLREIFIRVVSAYDHRAFYGVAPVSPAFTLAAVSRRWRMVAVTTSGLWTNVRLVFSRGCLDALIPHLSALLDRVGDHGLHLVMMSAPCDEPGASTSAVRAILARAFSRCRIIQVSWSDPDIRFSWSLLPMCLGSMPLLSQFIVKQHPDDATGFRVSAAPESLKILTLCPNVRVLELHSLPLDMVDPRYLPNVDAFSVSTVITSLDLRAIHRAWPRLRRLQLHGVQKVGVWDDADVFANLERAACISNSQSLFAVIPRSSLPVLHTLILKCDSIAIAELFTDHFCKSPWGTIRSLTLNGSHVDRLDQSLGSLPNLVELRLIAVPRLPLSALLDTLPGYIYPRRVDCLKLVNCEFGGVAFVSFLDFVTRRTGSTVSSPFRAISVQQSESLLGTEDVFPGWLAAYAEQRVDMFSLDVTDFDGPMSQHSWI